MKGVVGINRLQMTDERILAFIQRNFRCRFLDIIMPIISAMGNVGGVWLATGIAFCISKTYRYYGFILVGTRLLCGLVGNLSLKPLVARARPCHRYPDYPLLITRPKDYSFPSCHTLASFASMMVIWAANPIFGVFALFMAILIAFSRMYLFVHYPSDILAAMVMGVLMPWSFLLILARLYPFFKRLSRQ